MKDKKKGTRIKIKKLIFSAMFIVSLIMLMIAVSFSWFIDGKIASISGVTITAAEANNLLIKRGGQEWEKVQEIPIIEDFQFCAVTGDGNDFVTPVLDIIDGNDFEVVRYTPIYEDEKNTAGIYETTFSLMVENSKPLCLGAGSSVAPVELPHSAYGDYSAGYICGAIRVAFYQLQENGSYKLKCIWIPNSTVRLDTSGKTAINIEKKVENLEEKYVFYHSKTDTETVIETNGQISGRVVENDVIYLWGDISEDQQLTTITGGEELGLKMVVWVDGTDRECHNALLNGKIQMDIIFTVPNTEEG